MELSFSLVSTSSIGDYTALDIKVAEAKKAAAKSRKTADSKIAKLQKQIDGYKIQKEKPAMTQAGAANLRVSIKNNTAEIRSIKQDHNDLIQSLTSGIPKSALRGVDLGLFKIAKASGTDEEGKLDDKARAIAAKNKMLQMAYAARQKAEAEVIRIGADIEKLEQEIYNLTRSGKVKVASNSVSTSAETIGIKLSALTTDQREKLNRKIQTALGPKLKVQNGPKVYVKLADSNLKPILLPIHSVVFVGSRIAAVSITVSTDNIRTIQSDANFKTRFVSAVIASKKTIPDVVYRELSQRRK